MSQLKIYGIAQSRAIRSLWMAEELGLDYEHIKTHFVEDSKKPEFLKINPEWTYPSNRRRWLHFVGIARDQPLLGEKAWRRFSAQGTNRRRTRDTVEYLGFDRVRKAAVDDSGTPPGHRNVSP